jgi:hypothetical protein
MLSLLLVQALLNAYPHQLDGFTKQGIIWKDGTNTPLFEPSNPLYPADELENPTFKDQLTSSSYVKGILDSPPETDPGRIRYEPFFKKMYGTNQREVEEKLVTIHWLPQYFDQKCSLKITSVNQVDQRLIAISNALELLIKYRPEYLKFIENAPHTYQWRFIAHTDRLSMHSFGIAIDIAVDYSDYWQWDLQQKHLPITEDAPLLNYQNQIPWDIIDIFEGHGFIWGGKWRHYDTMHFEYRPELLP